jgi:uncharacterized protein YutE (UPF0331/DUF86 family)
MIDIEKIKKRSSEILENTQKILRLTAISDEEFWADERNILSVKHLLLESIEACGNICIHVSAKKIFKAAASFAECFENLAVAGIVDADLAQRLRAMSRFRNILVHRYWDVTDQKILEYARTNLNDFDDFLKSILKYLDL